MDLAANTLTALGNKSPEKWEGLAIGPQLANGSYVVLVGTDLISDGAALSMNALVIGEPRARSTSLAMFFPAGPIVPKKMPIRRYVAAAISYALFIFAPIYF